MIIGFFNTFLFSIFAALFEFILVMAGVEWWLGAIFMLIAAFIDGLRWSFRSSTAKNELSERPARPAPMSSGYSYRRNSRSSSYGGGDDGSSAAIMAASTWSSMSSSSSSYSSDSSSSSSSSDGGGGGGGSE